MDPNLIKLFNELTPIETQQLMDKKNHDDLLSSSQLQVKKSSVPIVTNNLIKNRNILITKHNRFCDYPLHSHTFTEINYQFSGSSRQIVNGQEINLKEGDILLLAPGTEHEISRLSKNDIMLNIIFNASTFNFTKLIQADNDYLKQIFINKVFNSGFLVFKAENSESMLTHTVLDLIHEYYFPKELSKKVLHNLGNLFFLLLYRNIDTSIKLSPGIKHTDIITNILRDMMQDYQTISLATLANKYNYNKNYLSNIFKQKIGKTFSEVLLDRRLSEAAKLLKQNKNISIQDIIQNCGFSNRAFFYKKFEERYKLTPGKYRNK